MPPAPSFPVYIPTPDPPLLPREARFVSHEEARERKWKREYALTIEEGAQQIFAAREAGPNWRSLSNTPAPRTGKGSKGGGRGGGKSIPPSSISPLLLRAAPVEVQSLPALRDVPSQQRESNSQIPPTRGMGRSSRRDDLKKAGIQFDDQGDIGQSGDEGTVIEEVTGDWTS